MSAAPARLVADGVSWTAPEGVPVLRDVDLVASRGRVTGLLGPNGSGKTTLLHVLAGLRRPATGRVTLDDHDVHGLSPGARSRSVAVLEQHATTSLDLGVRQVVELGRVPHRSRWSLARDHAEEVVEQAMRLCGVTALAARRWSSLSGGERQRVQLARALAQQPRLLVLDEPTNHLDLGHQIDFLATVRSLGTTVVAALHDLEHAAAFCDHLVVLDQGRVVASGDVGDVLTSDLLDRVYGVVADVERHPVVDRPHVVWSGTSRALGQPEAP
ncbi:MAG: ABC transporter ATP-binding protein [Propionibacteriales bacterium]|nr:ABC transporter ATP-binding protein [Propionibacteriales bacterium]